MLVASVSRLTVVLSVPLADPVARTIPPYIRERVALLSLLEISTVMVLEVYGPVLLSGTQVIPNPVFSLNVSTPRDANEAASSMIGMKYPPLPECGISAT